jgi:hypothetical protein
MYYLQTLELYNRAYEEFLINSKKDEEDFVLLKKIARTIYHQRKELFPEPSHKNWIENEDNFDCFLTSMFLQKHNYSSYPILCQELNKSLNELDPCYDSLIQLVNHPYSVPLSVIHYVTAYIILEEDLLEDKSNVFMTDFFRLYRNYLARNLKIDPFFILETF